MNQLFLAFDGDNAGQHIGQAILANDVDMLNRASSKIKAGGQLIEGWVKESGGHVVSSGGDEGTFIIDPSKEGDLEELRSEYESVTGFTATMGLGHSLSEAGKALIAGKLTGKNKIVKYDDEVEEILHQAHEAVHAGTADEEQKKMDEHYIDPAMYSQDDDELYGGHAEESEEDMMQFPEDSNDSFSDKDHDDSSEVEDQDWGSDYDQSPNHSSDYDQSDLDLDEDQQRFAEDSGEMPLMPGGPEDMPGEESHSEDYPESEFESEEPIVLEDSNKIEEDGGEDEAKADGVEMSDGEEAPSENPDDLESELADVDGNEEILQRIAQNLAAFKENRAAMEQVKQANPELYQSMVELLQNMVEMARMIHPGVVNGNGAGDIPEQEPQNPEQDSDMADAVASAAGEQDLPKQRG
jgi:hypothetical protein